MKTRRLMAIILLGTLVFGLAPSAKACDGYGYGWDCGLGWLYNSLQYNVPYYAAFPPVYYSYPVPRTYGYSPFAYPPGVMTPDILAPPEPLEIINPHVPSTKANAPAEKADTTAAFRGQPEPLVILNPYVNQQAEKSLARAAQ